MDSSVLDYWGIMIGCIIGANISIYILNKFGNFFRKIFPSLEENFNKDIKEWNFTSKFILAPIMYILSVLFLCSVVIICIILSRIFLLVLSGL